MSGKRLSWHFNVTILTELTINIAKNVALTVAIELKLYIFIAGIVLFIVIKRLIYKRRETEQTEPASVIKFKRPSNNDGNFWRHLVSSRATMLSSILDCLYIYKK